MCAAGRRAVTWIPVHLISEPAGTWLGISSESQGWHWAKDRSGPGEPLVGSPAMVPALPLLEQDRVSVVQRLRKAAVDNDVEEFPFGSLLGDAMRSGMEYWAALALDWAEGGLTDAVVAERAAELSDAPWASQRTRQRARRLASRPR
jgi:hypothetical protein